MKFTNPDVQTEYDRWIKALEGKDQYTSANTLGMHDVLRAHFLIADFFISEGYIADEDGLGIIGPQSLDLLHSALYRQHAGFIKNKYTNTFDIAATLLYGLVKNHAFHNANKRTAFLSILYFLYRAGYTPSAEHKEFEDFIVEVANDDIKKRRRYQDLIGQCDDPEVQYISYVLRKSTREIKKQQYVITVRELVRILNKYGFDLKYPHGSQIGVYKNVPRKLVVPFTKKPLLPLEKKIGTIGYAGMTKQVSKGDLKKVREMTGLTERNGIDSEVFYRDADALEHLIAKFQEPLRRLADR